MPHTKEFSMITILSRIFPISPIDTYFFKIHSNIVLPSTPRLCLRSLPAGFPFKIFKALLPLSKVIGREDWGRKLDARVQFGL